MTLQSSAARTVVKSLLFLLCLSVSAGSADAKLLQLIQAVLSSNLTRPHWRMSQLIENNNVSDAKHPQVAIDPSGNAIVVWQQQDDNHINRIWANRYANGSWGTAQIIDANAGDAEEPQISVDSLGNAIAVWSQLDGSHWKVWAARYDAASGWHTAHLIEEDAYLPQVAIHTSSGHTVAVWEHWPANGSPSNIHAAFYDMASDSWQTAVQISPVGGDHALLPQVAIDESGNAIAVWQQDEGTGEVSIYASRYANGSWDTAQIIDSKISAANNQQVAVDSNGNATVVWQQLYGGSSNIWSNRYDINKGWATAQVIGTTNSSEPQVAVDFNGNTFIVWHQFKDSKWKIFANRYDVINDWGAAEIIEDVFGDAKVPQVACDPAGHAFLVWQQSDGTHWNISSTRYAAGDWIIPHKVINNAGEAYNPQIAVNASGKAVAVWEQTDGINTSIWAVRYE